MMNTKDGIKHAEQSAPTCQMEELYDDLRQSQRHVHGRYAVLLRYSVLNRLFQQPYQRRLIATAFNKFVHSGDIQLYWRSNFDLYVVQVGKTRIKFELLITEAQRAVEEDEFIRSIEGDIKNDKLYHWYNLEKDMPALMSEIQEICQEPAQQKKPTNNMFGSMNKKSLNDLKAEDSVIASLRDMEEKMLDTSLEYSSISKPEVKRHMGPMQLAQLERNIENVDILEMMAEQDICVILPNADPHVIFTEKYISVGTLAQKLLPNYNIGGEIWLFQRLTETFDRKLFSSGFDKTVREEQVVSINCNVTSIMSRNFDHFITRYKMNHSAPLILEFRLFDILANIGKYFEMREKLKKLGCRVCIETMDIRAVGIIDRKITNVDFIKIPWNKNFKEIISGKLGDEIKSKLDDQDKMRIILIHCDSLEAITFGQSLGIRIFQGFYVDGLEK